MYLLYGEYMPQFNFSASALVWFLMQFLPTIGPRKGQQLHTQPHWGLSQFIWRFCLWITLELCKVMTLGFSTNHHYWTAEEPHSSLWARASPWLPCFCFLARCSESLHPPESIHSSVSSLLLVLQSLRAFLLLNQSTELWTNCWDMA